MFDYAYVSNLRQVLQNHLRGLHTKMTELEALRYGEDEIALNPEENASGLEARVGLTGEMIENVKASLTADLPRARISPHRSGAEAMANASKREKYHNAWLRWVNTGTQNLSELADSMIGLGLGIAKPYYKPWPTDQRRKRKGESDSEFLKRQIELKKLWGPPHGLTTVHPLSSYFHMAPDNRVSEMVEQSLKFKADVYSNYTRDREKLDVPTMMASTGHPDNPVQALPDGVLTTAMERVTEYFNRDIQQIYFSGQLKVEYDKPRVGYFLCGGRTSSSKDPDKWALSVAEGLRHNEPLINRALTRMAEATDLMTRRRLALKQPDGGLPTPQSPEGDPSTMTISLQADAIEILPPGSDVLDPFEGAYHAYDAMPFINMLISLTAQHGVNPIFKGDTFAGASGYDSNSRYAMAKAQYQYLLDSYQNCLAQVIAWNEWCIVNHVKQEVWCDEYNLSPSDIIGHPATITVEVLPSLPQNFIAKAEHYDRMHARGHITRRRVQEEGIGIEHPEEETIERLVEDVIEMLKPVLAQDALQTVFRRPVGEATTSGLVGPDGQPISSNGSRPAQGVGRDIGRQMGGEAVVGRERQPPIQPNELPPQAMQ